MSDLARRYTRHGLPVGVQSRVDGKQVITGYAAVFYDPNDQGTEYRIYDDLVERIMPGAFDRALREDDVRGLFNHDDSAILGRVSAGTMRLSVDKRGLKYEIDPPDTQAGRDVMVSLARRDVTGSSFMFRPKDTSTRIVDGTYILERNAVYLFDVGPVSFPAYESTEASVRGGADREAVRREVEAWAKSRNRSGAGAVKARARAVTVAMSN
jgi:HK97 family phage prohead protease